MHKLPRDLVTILRTEARNQRTPPIDYVVAGDGGRMVHTPEPDIAMAELLEEAADALEAARAARTGGVKVKPLDEHDYEKIISAAAINMRKAAGIRGQMITVQDGFDWWVMKETEHRILSALEPAASGARCVGWTPITEKNGVMTCSLPADETVVEVMLKDGNVCRAWYSCNLMEAGDWDFVPVAANGEPDDDANSIASEVVAWRYALQPARPTEQAVSMKWLADWQGRHDIVMPIAAYNELQSAITRPAVTDEMVEAAAKSLRPDLFTPLGADDLRSDDFAWTRREDAKVDALHKARAALKAAMEVGHADH